MPVRIVTADERLSAAHNKSSLAIFGLPGAGKTSLLKTLPADQTVCLDLEAGMKSVQDWPGASIPVRSFIDFRDLAVLIGGPDPAADPNAWYSGGVYADYRLGYPSQSYIPGVPAAEDVISVGVKTQYATPTVRSVSDTSATRARVTVTVPALFRVDTSGSQYPYVTQFTVEVQPDGGGYQLVLGATVFEKCISPAQLTYDIPLPGTGPWNIRLTRQTLTRRQPRSRTTCILQRTRSCAITACHIQTRLSCISRSTRSSSAANFRRYSTKGRCCCSRCRRTTIRRRGNIPESGTGPFRRHGAQSCMGSLGVPYQ